MLLIMEIFSIFLLCFQLFSVSYHAEGTSVLSNQLKGFKNRCFEMFMRSQVELKVPVRPGSWYLYVNRKRCCRIILMLSLMPK